MRKVFLLIFIALSYIGCADDQDNFNSTCKVCDDFTSSGATLEICDNGNNTATLSIILSGIDVYNDVIEIESSNSFNNLDCEYFNDLELDF